MPADPSSSGEESDTATVPHQGCGAVPVHLAIGAVLQGLCLFLSRPSLWAKVVLPILVSLATTIASLSMLFGLALRPQANLFHQLGWPYWIAYITAVLAVLVEVALVNLIIMLVLFGQVQSQIFRKILEEKGLLQKLRERHGRDELPEQCCLRDVGHSIRFLLARVPLLIITLPLQAIPVAGQIAWCLLNGWLYAWELEAEFMVMFRELYSCDQQYEFVKENCAAFATFGAGAMGLEMIPFIGPWIFFASNACGAALLAEAIMERYPDDPAQLANQTSQQALPEVQLAASSPLHATNTTKESA